MENADPLTRARSCLEGLSVGDAFGDPFHGRWPQDWTEADLPDRTWPWTDDTHMALSIIEVLQEHGTIDQDALARAFAHRYQQEPFRGYARGAIKLLTQIGDGGDWRQLSPTLFSGGSYGNGAAMRVAPIGAFFADDMARVVEEACRSAVVTHAHPEGQAGAVAVAVAAAVAASKLPPRGEAFLQAVLRHVPAGDTRAGIESSLKIPANKPIVAMLKLGTGAKVSSQDTVPFCIWCAAHNLDDYERALWTTVRGGGDCDTTCAIVGGIVALSAADIPALWLTLREPLEAVR